MATRSSVRSSEFASNPNIRFVWYGVVALILSVVHVVFLRFLEVSSVTPDLLLVFTVWVALVEGQFTGMIAGFLCGVLFDVVSTDVIGTNALAKTFAGFIAGYFFREGFASEQIGSSRFLFIVALAALVHNLVYNFFFLRPMQTSFLMFFLQYGVASTLYTTTAAIFPMLYTNRKKE